LFRSEPDEHKAPAPMSDREDGFSYDRFVSIHVARCSSRRRRAMNRRS
jgi:hypothetical protein